MDNSTNTGAGPCAMPAKMPAKSGPELLPLQRTRSGLPPSDPKDAPIAPPSK